MKHNYKNLNVYVCGDIHGNFAYLIHMIRTYHITNSIVILAGDVGLGFSKMECYNQYYIGKMHKFLEQANVTILGVRGNHDDPSYFNSRLIDFPYFKTVADYDIILTDVGNILCIGGAISVDKDLRIKEDSKAIRYGSNKRTWWADECPVLNEEILLNEDYSIIVSHCAPSVAMPIVTWYGDLGDRDVMNEVLNLSSHKVTKWYYGHYHNSYTQIIDGITFNLLNINEIKEIKPEVSEE